MSRVDLKEILPQLCDMFAFDQQSSTPNEQHIYLGFTEVRPRIRRESIDLLENGGYIVKMFQVKKQKSGEFHVVASAIVSPRQDDD